MLRSFSAGLRLGQARARASSMPGHGARASRLLLLWLLCLGGSLPCRGFCTSSPGRVLCQPFLLPGLPRLVYGLLFLFSPREPGSLMARMWILLVAHVGLSCGLWEADFRPPDFDLQSRASPNGSHHTQAAWGLWHEGGNGTRTKSFLRVTLNKQISSSWAAGRDASVVNVSPEGNSVPRPSITQPCSPLLQVWLLMHEVPSCVKPVLHRLQFLLEPSQLKQFSSHLCGDTSSCCCLVKKPNHSRPPS